MITREEAKELLPIIQAFAEGKPIQDKIEGVTDWVDTDEINLEYEGQKIKHRIKPEPKYRPFKTQEECWQEMLKHQPFGWVIETVTNYHKHITTVLGCNIIFYDSTGFKTSFDLMLRDCIFADGTPFGIKEE